MKKMLLILACGGLFSAFPISLAQAAGNNVPFSRPMVQDGITSTGGNPFDVRTQQSKATVKLPARRRTSATPAATEDRTVAVESKNVRRSSKKSARHKRKSDGNNFAASPERNPSSPPFRN